MSGSSQNKRLWSPTVVESSSPMRKSSHPLSSLLEEISNYRVLVVGDAITDEYCYVTPYGMAAKDNILSCGFQRTESFDGGVVAASRHIAGFCKDVQLSCGPGYVVKRRFVEEAYTRKLFAVEYPGIGADCTKDNYQDFDLVVVTDFGHGFVTGQMIYELTSRSQFLAINAQTNSANRGFNLITKYPRADYVVIDGLEARLAAQDRDSPIEDVIHKLGFPKIVVTLGADGAVGFDGEFHYSTALTKKVVDTMGAGDAFFCVTAPLAAVGADMQTILEVGNAAGAIKCGQVGQKAVTREA